MTEIAYVSHLIPQMNLNRIINYYEHLLELSISLESFHHEICRSSHTSDYVTCLNPQSRNVKSQH